MLFECGRGRLFGTYVGFNPNRAKIGVALFRTLELLTEGKLVEEDTEVVLLADPGFNEGWADDGTQLECVRDSEYLVMDPRLDGLCPGTVVGEAVDLFMWTYGGRNSRGVDGFSTISKFRDDGSILSCGVLLDEGNTKLNRLRPVLVGQLEVIASAGFGSKCYSFVRGTEPQIGDTEGGDGAGPDTKASAEGSGEQAAAFHLPEASGPE